MQERIPTTVYRLKLKARVEGDLNTARAVLLSIGLTQDQFSEGGKTNEHIIEIFCEDVLKANRIFGLFSRLALKGVVISKTSLKPKDWLTRWKAGWKPGALTKKIDIVPVWHRKSYKVKKGREFLLMDTLMSFGTGLHETTRIVAQMIEDRRGQFSNMIDIGTGTGVLAMVAIKYGAKDVKAFDIGELSVEAAQSNFKLNKLSADIFLGDISKYKAKTKYDFVAANLVTHDLIKFRKQIVSFVRPGGLLAVSGISLERVEELRKGFTDMKLKELQIVKQTQWAGILYEK